jgi:tRNA G37 N-methylase TrmD
MPDRSDHKAVQVILHKIHKGGINYIASVSKSFNTAESGLAFAKLAQELCIILSSGRDEGFDELIQDSITEMREIARKAHADAKATMDMLDANRREFTEVRHSHTDETVLRQHL